MNQRATIGLLGLGLLAAVGAAPRLPAAAASTGAYQVEIVIFRAISPPIGEDLSAPAEGRGFTGPAAGDTPPPDLLRVLDSSQMQLGSMASKLRASGEWTVLAHTGWVQTATEWPHHAGLSLEQLGINAAGLHGTVYLEHGQYLHLGFDLQLGSEPSWSLRELRRIRFSEKNYFDHPGFGVIAIVSPARVAG